MKYQDYYQTLGVSRDASADEIKKAFRRLARKYHPDISKEADAEERMKAVNEAYAVLSDTEKRAAYDQLGPGHHAGEDFRPPPDWGGGFEPSGRGFSPDEAAQFSDFFSQLFGGLGGGHGGFHAQGEDRHVRIELDLEDTFHGASRTLSLRLPEVDAHGRVHTRSRTLNVKIPKGVREGQIIRLAGQGGRGLGDGAPGDLLLEVRFAPHPRLRAEGRDLHMSLPVTPWEAALGAIVPVELPSGTVKVRIPKDTQSSHQLRVRGKGIPSATPGDLLLDIQVVLPRADTAKARQLYETMAQELAFDPRHSGSV